MRYELTDDRFIIFLYHYYIKNDVIMQDCHSELKHKVSVREDYNSHFLVIFQSENFLPYFPD